MATRRQARPARRKPQSRADSPDKRELLPPPSPELAKRILTEVGWEERIEGFLEAPMRGPMREFVFKFGDAAKLLRADVSDPWSTRSGIFGYFEFGELEAWIRNVFGDKELADEIAAILAADCSLQERIERIKPLMELRLRQCEEVRAITG